MFLFLGTNIIRSQRRQFGQIFLAGNEQHKERKDLHQPLKKMGENIKCFCGATEKLAEVYTSWSRFSSLLSVFE